MAFFAVAFIWFQARNKPINNVISSDKIPPPAGPEVQELERKKFEDSAENLQKLLDQKQKTDFDLDGLSDLEEKQLATDPKKIDTDGDGLTDYDEIKIYHTNPLKADTDGDSYVDGAELRRGYDPLGPGKFKK